MRMSSDLLDRLGIRICCDSVGGVSGGSASNAGGTSDSSAGGAAGTGDAGGASGSGEAAGGVDVGASGDAGPSCSAADGFSGALGAAADEAASSEDDTAAAERASCTLGDEGLRDYDASAPAAAELAAETRAVEAGAAEIGIGPSQEFSPGDIDPVTNHTIADVTAQGRITSEIDENGRALTGAALTDVQRAAVAAAIDPGPAPASADLTLAGFADPSGLYTGFVTELDPAGQPLSEAVPISQSAPVAPARSWSDDFGDYLANSWDALSRIPRDVQAMAEDLVTDPLGFAQRIGPSLAGLGVGMPLTRAAPAASGVWGLGPATRGVTIEQALGANLPGNFPVVDRFAAGIATSIKSLDLNAPTYQNAQALTSQVTRYIDQVAAFSGRSWAGARIRGDEITARALHLAIPSGGTAAQRAVLDQAVAYGAQRGVTVTITVYP